MQKNLFGLTEIVPQEEYHQFYDTTGLDIDGRREWIANLVPKMEKSIKRFITFAKGIPGFKDLPTDDQVAIIKGKKRSHTCMLKKNDNTMK